MGCSRDKETWVTPKRNPQPDRLNHRHRLLFLDDTLEQSRLYRLHRRPLDLTTSRTPSQTGTRHRSAFCDRRDRVGVSKTQTVLPSTETAAMMFAVKEVGSTRPSAIN